MTPLHLSCEGCVIVLECFPDCFAPRQDLPSCRPCRAEGASLPVAGRLATMPAARRVQGMACHCGQALFTPPPQLLSVAAAQPPEAWLPALSRRSWRAPSWAPVRATQCKQMSSLRWGSCNSFMLR